MSNPAPPAAGWRADLAALTALADSTLLLAMDAETAASASIGVPAMPSAIVDRLRTQIQTVADRLVLSERQLNAAEASFALPAAELRDWETNLLSVAARLEKIRDVTDDALTVPVPKIARVSLAEKRNELLGSAANAPSPSSSRAMAAGAVDMSPAQLQLLQQEMIDDQDGQLDALAAVVGRQKLVALDMDGELDTQVRLLDTFDEDLDQAESRLRRAQQGVANVLTKSSASSAWWLIAALVIILVLLIVIL
ncbi:hypothetical protein AMAG_14383 [Allomyces macrogynus ATCC 38327]|uniref:t-SNARE coiled-coil homology domain-containing protein n=1 Tax=Allomyces macrogynus (strain ATCC 38327) TaxID=578462 RepID=A0A0L0T573_ALLM3|nr:hypothetical protein AMAG_14383 [Allomyces macrogynus ATCC 38327]|eukprot:KNE69856.1 hypothetical protein AMAG_14383 [Allomyces macrogynus ATCC 38327]